MAYGAIATPAYDSARLPSVLAYNLPRQKRLLVFPLTLDQTPDGLLAHMAECFRLEVEKGQTYPQRDPVTSSSFTSYFYGAGLVFVGLVVGADEEEDEDEVKGGMEEVTVEEARAGRRWEDCLGGFFYVKPNYPGRSSHNCNGGFLVSPTQRGLRIGSALGRAYLVVAPRLGYRASVFNLVYTNNTASLAIWDRLGFTRAGLVPEAGLLRKTDGSDEEEYVDAVVFYKKF